MPEFGLEPEPTTAARVTRWAFVAVDVVAGVLCGVVVHWLPLVVDRWAALAVVAVLGAIGWAIRRRAWAVACVATALALTLLGR